MTSKRVVVMTGSRARWSVVVIMGAMLASGGCGSPAPHAPDAPPVDAPTDSANVIDARIALVDFAAKIDFPTGANATAVAIADLDGDGKLDLVIGNTNTTTVSVMLNTTPAGAAMPSFATRVDFPSGMAPASIAIGDLNGDGKPDLAVANAVGSTVSVLLGTTPSGAVTPTFAPAVELATGANPESVALADVNGDAKPDLVTANVGAGTVSVLLNTTATGAVVPSFGAAVDFPTGAGAVAVAAQDLDGDTRPDLVVANLSANTASVLLDTTTAGATTPSFAAKVDVPTGLRPIAVVIADLNGDGKPDLAVVDQDASTVSVVLNTTTAVGLVGFAARVAIASGAGPGFVAAANLGGDGSVDLAVVNSTASTVSILVDTTPTHAATPSFATKVDFPTGAGPRAVAIGDLDGDGKLDLAVANGLANTVSLLRAR